MRGGIAIECGDERPGEPNSIPPSAFSHVRLMPHYAAEVCSSIANRIELRELGR
jgi:hypothetical protein